MSRIISKILVVISLLGLMTACNKTEPKLIDSHDKLVTETINLLSEKSIILDTKAYMGTIDKTLLPKGCPTKFDFKWLPKENKMEISLLDFSVGMMPLSINFRINVAFSELNIWDKDTYPEKGWIKFEASNGWLLATPKPGEPEPDKIDNPATIEGFVNPLTHEIQFTINYNMMGVKSFCIRQKINLSRIKHFKEEFETYEKNLIKYKKEHGII